MMSNNKRFLRLAAGPAPRCYANGAMPPPNRIIQGDNLEILPTLPDAFARLIYIDPPFNTGKIQKRDRIKAIADEFVIGRPCV